MDAVPWWLLGGMLFFAALIVVCGFVYLAGEREVKAMDPEEWARREKEFLHLVFSLTRGSPARAIPEDKVRAKLRWKEQVFDGVRDLLAGADLIIAEETQTRTSKLLSDTSIDREPTMKAMIRITTKGANLVRDDPNSITAPTKPMSITDSVVMHGGTGHNVAHKSPFAQQSQVSYQQHATALREFVHSVRSDTTLTTPEREQAERLAADAEAEMGKPEPDRKILNSVLGAMVPIAVKAGWPVVEKLIKDAVGL